MPGREQLFDKMRADEASATCNENSHENKLATDGHRFPNNHAVRHFSETPASNTDATQFKNRASEKANKSSLKRTRRSQLPARISFPLAEMQLVNGGRASPG